MRNVIFDNVVVNNPSLKPWGNDFYLCENIHGVAMGKTNPIPPCFVKLETEVLENEHFAEY
jgi:hypothetical protein